MSDPADLSDAELCEAVAREVLGAEQPSDTQRAFGNVGLELDWSGIGQVVEAMWHKGWTFEFAYSTQDETSAFFWREEEYKRGMHGAPDTPSHQWSKHENPVRAVDGEEG